MAKSAGVEAGVYSNATLVNIINARADDNITLVNHFLKQTNDSVRISSRGTSVDFDRLIDQAEQDNNSAQVASLKSLSKGDNYTGGVDADRLIAMALEDGEFGKAAALRSQFGG